jgi:hypothetical protein
MLSHSELHVKVQKDEGTHHLRIGLPRDPYRERLRYAAHDHLRRKAAHGNS